jgi:HlyD family secretion protein
MRVTAKLVLLVAVITACVLLYRYRPWGKGDDDQRVKFETTKIDRGPIVAKVTASGTLSALRTVQVGSQVSGRIQKLLADFNTHVRRGQIIARLDPQLLVSALEQARANYVAAQADLEAARVQSQNSDKQLVRAKALSDRKLTAQADYDQAEADANVARANVASAQGRLAQSKASLHQSEINLDYATIESPIDGVVISRSVDEGQTVAASLQAPVLFTIAEDLSKMQVDTSVAEADVGKLSDKMNAVFNVDAYPTERFEGRVRQIRYAAVNVQNVITYDAVIDVENALFKLFPGMTANVTFVHASRSDALRTVNAALRFKPAPELLERHPKRPGGSSPDNANPNANATANANANATAAKPRSTTLTSTQRKAAKMDESPDRRTLWVLRNHKPVSVPVKIGISDGTHTEVIEGDVHEGDEVITDVAGTAGPSSQQRPGAGGMRRIL